MILLLFIICIVNLITFYIMWIINITKNTESGTIILIHTVEHLEI